MSGDGSDGGVRFRATIAPVLCCEVMPLKIEPPPHVSPALPLGSPSTHTEPPERGSTRATGALTSIENAPVAMLPKATAATSGSFYADTLPARVVDLFSGKIERAWRSHRARALEGCQDGVDVPLRSTHPGYVTREYTADNLERYPGREREMGRVFYCARRGGVPFLYYPWWVQEAFRKKDEAPCMETLTAGMNKRCRSYDGPNAYVALEPLDVQDVLMPGRLDACRALFEGTRTLVFTTFIHPRLLIARDAGIDLYEYLTAGNVLRLDDLHDVVADVTHLHAMHERGGAYFRDLKPENLCIRRAQAPDAEGPRFRLSIVDFEDTLVFGDELPFLHRGHLQGTADYLTHGLVLDLYTGPAEHRRRVAEAADLYALLRTVIAATAEATSALRGEATLSAPLDLGARRAASPTGVLQAHNVNLFKPWIERHVHPWHWGDAWLLLKDPARFAQTRGGHVTLRQMLRFQPQPANALTAG